MIKDRQEVYEVNGDEFWIDFYVWNEELLKRVKSAIDFEEFKLGSVKDFDGDDTSYDVFFNNKELDEYVRVVKWEMGGE